MKKLILFLLLASVGWSQNTGQNVVYTTLVNTLTNVSPVVLTSTCNTVSCQIQNIGQTSHLVTVSISCFPTCNFSYSGVMQGSVDGTTYYNIGPVISVGNTTTAVKVNLVGYGAYPFLRTYGTVPINSGSVAVIEEYTGTSAPVFNNVDQYSSNNGLSVLSFSSTGSTLVYNMEEDVAQAGSGNSIVVYGFSVSGVSTMTELTISCGTISGAVKTIVDVINASNLQFNSPPGLRGYPACSPPNNYLYYEALGSGVGSLNIYYRVE